MSPITPPQSRAEASRRRRNETTRARGSQAREHVRQGASAPTLSRVRVARQARPPSRSRVRRRYQVSVPFGGSASLSLPSLRLEGGPRSISGLLLVGTLALLALLWFVPPFVVGGAEIHGNLRLGPSEINGVLAMTGRPLVTAQPEELADSLRAAFPEIRDVSVRVGFPSRLIVALTERAPLVTWQQADQTLWIDAEGVAFPPRGAADGLITVQASGTPPFTAEPETAGLAGAHRLLSPDAVTALQVITPYVPPGSALIYDRSYGLGWRDSRGWDAYFGQTTGDMSLKLRMYQIIVDSLAQRGLQPTLISVEFSDAPFYRVEQ